MDIPEDKRFFRIGEASRIVGVPPHVLRYWESEFSQLRPRRADSKQRTYQKKDLELLLFIKRLLYEEKLTIEGAKKRLKERARAEPAPKELLQEIKDELISLIKLLSK